VLFISTQFSNLYTAVDTPARGRVGSLIERWTFRPRSSPTRSSLRVSPAFLSIGFALVRWKGVKWNWALVVIGLVFKTPQVRASSSDLVTMEFVSYLTRCYGTYSLCSRVLEYWCSAKKKISLHTHTHTVMSGGASSCAQDDDSDRGEDQDSFCF